MSVTRQSIDREEVARHRAQIQQNPESPAHLRNAVEYFIEAGLVREAYEPLRKLIKLQPQDTSLQLLWGAVSIELGQIDQAERAFIEVTRQDPQSTVGYHNLGLLYFASGRPQRAEEQFTAILSLKPDNKEALNDLAVLYASTDRGARAQSMYEQCLTLAPDYKKCWLNALDFAYSTGRFAAGAEWLSRLAAKNPGDADLAGWRSKFVRVCRKSAGRLIFATGIMPGAAQRDRRLEDTDEISFGAVDWRPYSNQKKCVAFLCSSPSVRGNYQWYHRRFAERGWPIVTAAPDIYLNVPEAHFVPPVLNLSLTEYTRPGFDVSPLVVVYHERPGYAAGGENMLGPVARRLKEKYGQQVLFGRCVEMTLQQTLLFRHKAHIGFDRLSFGAPHFGLTSLENSALGLVNIVYLDPFTRALLARTLGTDELPWLSPDSVDALYETIDRLAGDPDNLVKQMRKTAEWFRRWWSENRIIRHLTAVLENT